MMETIVKLGSDFMDLLVKLSKGLTGIIGAGGENFMGLITGVLPNVLILLTMINAIIALIGEDKINAMAKKATKYGVLRYTLLPLLGVFFLTNPMCYAIARFVDEEHKPAVIDALYKLVHPMTGIFSHANAGELFIWLGISGGITTLDKSTAPLAIRYLLVGILSALISGYVTEIITKIMLKRNVKNEAEV